MFWRSVETKHDIHSVKFEGQKETWTKGPYNFSFLGVFFRTTTKTIYFVVKVIILPFGHDHMDFISLNGLTSVILQEGDFYYNQL